MTSRKLTPNQMPSGCNIPGCTTPATHLATGFTPEGHRVGGSCCFAHRAATVAHLGGR